ncbi:MAG: CPBP family intramembrane glutamic endopeptidase, partial [bacterium]
MADINYSRDFPQHSLIKSAALSILPGVLVTGAFIILNAPLKSSGYPPLLAFLLAILLVDIPVMLGIMYYEGKKLNGSYSLNGIVLYREKVSWKTFVLLFIAAFVVVYLLIMLAAPITNVLTQSVFSGLPNWFFLEERSQYEAYSRNVLIVVFVFQLILTGIILPWVEELYFRGYLLPRISRFRAWAPLIGGFFFGLYHVWQLYGFATVFLLGTALGYIVWWKRDIRLSISLHIFANALVRLTFLMAALTM